VRVSAVLPTFYDGRTRLAREVLETLQGHFKHKCLEPIRHNTRLAEAPSHKKTIFEYAPSSHGATDYSRVCEWVRTATSQVEATLGSDAGRPAGPDPGPPGPNPVLRPRPDLARPEVLEVP
jgi:chromosome partitioning protein